MRNRTWSAASLAALLVVATATGCAKREVYVGTDPGSGVATGGAGGGAAAPTQSLVSELERFSVAQRAYFDANRQYAGSLAALGFAPASGVRIDVIQGDRLGFSAIASSGDNECAVYHGDVRSPRGYLSAPDVPACRG
ncbi:MAG: hypothetical protein R6X22_14345 [Gemmatimonadota bacterium]|jgi:hypothetical protein